MKTLKIMPVGDSITAGLLDNPVWNLPFKFGYRLGLYERLTKAGVDFQFVGQSEEPFAGAGDQGTPACYQPEFDLREIGQGAHNGYGGKSTAFVKERIEGWLKATPADVVLLMIGINDIPRGSAEEPKETEANLREIIEKIAAASPETTIIVAEVFPYAEKAEGLFKYNDHIREVLVPELAREGKKVFLVDQCTAFRQENGDGRPELYSNGINHPSETGYDIMARTWFDGMVRAGVVREWV